MIGNLVIIVVKRYHKTENGKDALRRSVLNRRIKEYNEKLVPVCHQMNNCLEVNMEPKDKLEILKNKGYYSGDKLPVDEFEKLKNLRNACIMELWELDRNLFPRGDKQTV